MSYFMNMKNTSRKPYIYKVTNLESGQYYIGSQCSGKTIGHNYFTSSTNKEFKDGFKTYGEEKYKIEIIKEFEDPDECGRAENYIIRNYMLKKDGLCLNRSYCCNGKKVFSTVGTHHSEETRKKISGVLKGITRSEETRKKQSLAKKGIHHTEEHKKKISVTLKGCPSLKKRKISIEGVVFESLTEASKYYNVFVSTISRWVKTKNHNAVYIEKCPKI